MSRRPARPFYVTVLRLKHVHPNTWQRTALGEGSIGLAMLLVLADLGSAWLLLALPLAVATVVKLHDLMAGQLSSAAPDRPGPSRTELSRTELSRRTRRRR